MLHVDHSKLGSWISEETTEPIDQSGVRDSAVTFRFIADNQYYSVTYGR